MAEEPWHTRTPLTRVEAAFRAMKSSLMEQPMLHRLEQRRQRPILICVLTYHLLVAIEQRFLEQGVRTPWGTIHQHLSTHQVVTVVLPATAGEILRIRKGTTRRICPAPLARSSLRAARAAADAH